MDAISEVNYFREAKEIWTQFVPLSGQADTRQGELLRAVEKLRDEATRNGNGNWDNGFRLLLAFLKQHLLDAGLFSAEQIGQSKAILKRLARSRDPEMDDAPYDYISARVVDYYRHYGSTPHQHNPELLR